MKAEKLIIYERPECTCLGVQTEGLLCSSVECDGSTINEFDKTIIDSWD